MYSFKSLLAASVLLFAGCPGKATDQGKGTAAAGTLSPQQQVPPRDGEVLPTDVAVPATAPKSPTAPTIDAGTSTPVDGGAGIADAKRADAGPL